MKSQYICVLVLGGQLATAQLPNTNGSTGVVSDGATLEAFYSPNDVQSIQLRVAQEDMQRLVAALPKRIYVPATFQWRDITKKAALRFKGNSSSNPKQQHKRSFLLKFDEYDENERFLGLRRVSFDNGVQFGSLFSEPIITEILRHQGIKTHRCNYAKVDINGEYRGVYGNVERIDESFIERHLSDVDGLLFKVDEGGPGCNLEFLGDDPNAYEHTFEAKTESARKEGARLVQFIKMVNQAEDNEFAAKLAENFEVDDFLRVTAVMLLSGAFDQLTGWNPHNYYLFQDRRIDRWQYLPWDLDVGLSETAFGHIRVLDDWNAAWPVPPSGRPSPLLQRIVNDQALLQRYRRIARSVLDEYFEPDRLCKVIDAKYELIKHDLQKDPFPHRRVTNPGDRGYDSIVQSMKTFVQKRYVSAAEQLDNPGPRPEIKHRSAGPHPGHLPARLANKIRRIEERAGRLQNKLKGVHEVMRNVGPLIGQGKVKEAEEALDKALKLVAEEPAAAEK